MVRNRLCDVGEGLHRESVIADHLGPIGAGRIWGCSSGLAMVESFIRRMTSVADGFHWDVMTSAARLCPP